MASKKKCGAHPQEASSSKKDHIFFHSASKILPSFVSECLLLNEDAGSLGANMLNNKISFALVEIKEKKLPGISIGAYGEDASK